MKKKAIYKDYVIIVEDNNSITATQNGEVSNNTKQTLRDIAQEVGFSYENKWNTQQFGAKLVNFLNANASKKNQKVHVRVEIDIPEMDFVAFDSDNEMLDESFVFSEDYPTDIHIYIDGKEIDIDEEGKEDIILDPGTPPDALESGYKAFKLNQKWHNHEFVQCGYYFSECSIYGWEFDVENFDIDKLNFCWELFDVIFDPTKYSIEARQYSLYYDGKRLKETDYNWEENENFNQIWSLYDEEDEEEDYNDYDDEGDEGEEQVINNVVVKLDISGYGYAAEDSNENLVDGKFYSFYRHDGIKNLTVQVDGKNISEDIVKKINKEYSNYKNYDINWEDKNKVATIMSWEEEEHITWKFNVNDFDFDKLALYYQCYDVKIEIADYCIKLTHLDLMYDGRRIEVEDTGTKYGDNIIIWSKGN